MGLSAVGVTTADILEPGRVTLHQRKAGGLPGEMQFTYRNPDRSTEPRRRMPSARSLVVAALAYGSDATPGAGSAPAPGPPVDPLASAGRIARYMWSDHYRRLESMLDRLAEPLRAAGYQAQVILDSNHLVDRNVAWRAGLGWYGKNTNILLPGVGSWHVLGSILTDAPLDPTGEPLPDGCGPCRQCMDDCPTNAIIAPGVVDARRCIAWLVQAAEPIPVELRSAVGDRIYGCDDCQEVCPPNRAAAARSEAVETRADVGWLLTAADEAILARHGRWYIAHRDVDVIRRTALVVLGNTAEPSWGTDRIARLLRPHLTGDRAMTRNHAVWAARRLGLAASSRTGGRSVIELPVCCRGLDRVSDNPACPDPGLHRELTVPVRARYRAEAWLEIAR